jgi:hypothetical protein
VCTLFGSFPPHPLLPQKCNSKVHQISEETFWWYLLLSSCLSIPVLMIVCKHITPGCSSGRSFVWRFMTSSARELQHHPSVALYGKRPEQFLITTVIGLTVTTTHWVLYVNTVKNLYKPYKKVLAFIDVIYYCSSLTVHRKDMMENAVELRDFVLI